MQLNVIKATVCETQNKITGQQSPSERDRLAERFMQGTWIL